MAQLSAIRNITAPPLPGPVRAAARAYLAALPDADTLTAMLGLDQPDPQPAEWQPTRAPLMRLGRVPATRLKGRDSRTSVRNDCQRCGVVRGANGRREPLCGTCRRVTADLGERDLWDASGRTA